MITLRMVPRCRQEPTSESHPWLSTGAAVGSLEAQGGQPLTPRDTAEPARACSDTGHIAIRPDMHNECQSTDLTVQGQPFATKSMNQSTFIERIRSIGVS